MSALHLVKPPVCLASTKIRSPSVTLKNHCGTCLPRSYAKPKTPRSRTGKTVAIIGSGPAGLAAAEQLNAAGHSVTVFERDEKVGGLLRFGIPDFKLGMDVIDRKINLMEQAGVKFVVNAHIGVDINAQQLRQEFDAVLLTGGSTVPRDLSIPGRDLKGVYFAMQFLAQNNRRANGMDLKGEEIHAKGKHVVVIGGGDTGSDCVGTSNRHGAASITQVEIMPIPPQKRPVNMPWPQYPMILRTSTSHEEGCERHWNILTKEFIGNEQGEVTGLRIADIVWKDAAPGERPSFDEVVGSERVIPCDMAFLAMGFLHPEHTACLLSWGLSLMSAAMWRRKILRPTKKAYSPQVICAQANPWWCAVSTKVANVREPLTPS